MTPAPEPLPPRARPWWALVAAVVLTGTAGWLLAGIPVVPGDEASPQMLAVAPGGEIELSSLSEDHRHLYAAAAADPEAFEAVRCYCGCEAFLEHRHLLDCFQRPDGGWERHATGCAVCLGEAREVIELRADGVPLDDIVRRIDTRYGAITDPDAA